MNLTAATITIYFIGAMNFDTTPAYRVNVPLATDEPEVELVKLQPHRADVVITNWTSGGNAATGCAVIPGSSWNGTTQTCTVRGLEHQVIEVVSSEDLDVEDRFGRVPKLKDTALCPGLGGLNSNIGSAVKMAIPHGRLDACLHGQAWIAHLTVNAAGTGNFKIGPAANPSLIKTVTLDGGAVVHLINAPTTKPDKDEKKHFLWHYYMRNNRMGCSALPQELTPVPADIKCPSGIPELPHHPEGGGAGGLATGVGCSVTQYP